MAKKSLTTDFRAAKEARDAAIYAEWKRLMGRPGAMKTVVNKVIMRKYGIHSESTIWLIRKRIEADIISQ